MKTILSIPAAVLFLGLAGLSSGRSESFSEPPVVLYGKVIQVSAGANFQLYNGDLTLSISNETDADHVISKTIPLGPVGEGGAFSYRLEVPVKYLPGTKELPDNLSVGHQSTPYRLIAFSIDGVPAQPLDETLAQLQLQFADRAKVHRLDLKVALAPTDSDGDGMPDWWEDQYGLNRHYAADAAADPDGDDLTNLEEFRHATDPDASNFTPTVKTTRVVVPSGSRAGLSLLIVDQDTPPEELGLVVIHTVEGLTWYRDGEVLPDTQYFSYADVLAGRITLATAPNFQGAPVSMNLYDPRESSPDRTFVLQIETFSPGDLAPSLWLHAGTLHNNGPISEWPDASAFHRDGYQPFPASEPNAVSEEGVEFGQEQFLYLDDRDLVLSRFTAFLAFNVSATHAADQTLFSSPDLQLQLGGDANSGLARSLNLTQAGRVLHGPPLVTGPDQHIILGSGPDRSFLVDPGQQYFVSTPSAASPLSTFTTLGGLQRLSESSAREFLQGGVRELILFNRELDAEDRSLLEHYQRVRWEGWVLWENGEATLPMNIHGASDQHNVITGGWGNDTLHGGPLEDLIVAGPGADVCYGGAGPDCFQIFAASGNDVLGDFSTQEGDVIDLTGIFAERTGTPDQYVNIRAVVTRGADNVPVVDSLVELDYAGDGGNPDQVITLKGASLGNSDLPRLVGEGAIRLGGPRYETSVWLAAPETSLSEAGDAYEVQVVRSGNLDAALEVNLSFTGAAEVDVDYRVDGAGGSGAVRTVSLARGQAEQLFHIVPIPDSESEADTIKVQVLSSAVITDRPAAPMQLTLQDGSFLALRTLKHFQIGSTEPGRIQISRSGGLDQPLEVHLGLGGNLVAGVDYESVPEFVALAAGEAVKVVEIRPIAPRSASPVVEEVRVWLEEGSGSYLLGAPHQTSVLVLPDANAMSYAQWAQQAPAGQGLLDYVIGGDLSPAHGKLQIRGDYHVTELRFVTIASLTDVALSVNASSNLEQWKDVTEQFSEQLEWTADGRVRRLYRLKNPSSESQRYFRISARAL